MPIVDGFINNYIDQQLLVENAQREALHDPSGKLSAGVLFQPLRFQVLKTLGVPRKAIDPFVLGKFDVGNKIEETLVKRFEQSLCLLDTQVPLNYRGVVGFADTLIDSNVMQAKKGIMPCEIKSVANMKLKRIKAMGIDWHYKLQAGLYALAMKSDYFAVAIGSYESSQYVMLHIFQTSEMKKDIDTIIDNYNKAIEIWNRDHRLPPFVANPKVPWTANLAYSMFDSEWAVNDDVWAVKQLDALGLIKEIK